MQAGQTDVEGPQPASRSRLTPESLRRTTLVSSTLPQIAHAPRGSRGSARIRAITSERSHFSRESAAGGSVGARPSSAPSTWAHARQIAPVSLRTTNGTSLRWQKKQFEAGTQAVYGRGRLRA